MSDTVPTILALIVVFVALPVVLLRLNDLRRRRHTTPPREAEHQERERRLLNPDWTAVERRLRRRVPPALQELYTDRALITRREVEYGAHAITFEPLDEPAMMENSRWLGFDAVTIGTNGFGDAIHLRPGVDEADRVYMTHHDGGDTEVLSESMGRFVQGVRG